MARSLINTNDFRDSSITDAKIPNSTIPGTKIISPTTGANFQNYSISTQKMSFAYTPNLLRNGGFDESTTVTPPVGWTRNSVLGVSIAGYAQGDGVNAGTYQDSVQPYSIKISGPTSGVQYEVYQDVPLSAMGWGFINDPGTNGNYDVQLCFHYKTNATAYAKLTYYVNASPTNSTTFSNGTIMSTAPWRSGTTPSSIQPSAPNGSPTITAKVELGLDGGSGSYVYFDNIILYSKIAG